MSTGFNREYSENPPDYDQIKSLKGMTLVEFGAPWCGHCQSAEPWVEQALAVCETIRHIKVFDGKGKYLGRQFKVKRWPTLIVLQNGSEIARCIRPQSSQDIVDLLHQSTKT